jgi:hypothetical protein
VIVDLPDDEHVRLRLPDGTETELALATIKEALLLEETAADPRRKP